MGSRRHARELALQALYAIDAGSEVGDAMSGDFWFELEALDEDRNFAEALVLGVVESQDDLDQRIEAASHNWRIERMPVVDRNVLRMAVWEFLHAPSTPAAVIMDEAIEIVRRFSTSESTSFVNGILDRVAKGMSR
jgi:N utilization substance protein B